MTDIWTTQTKPQPKAPPGRDVPGPMLPLSYADPTVNRDDVRRVRGGWIELLGGIPQIAFAVGLGLVTGGVAYCMWPRTSEAVIWIGMGAMLIGLTLRLPLRD